MQTFNSLGLRPEILKALDEIGFEHPTEIQSKAIPALLESKPDFIGLAQTGTGKTAAFGLPLLHFTDTTVNHITSLIIAPTRELAQQIEKELTNFGKYIKGLRTTCVYGGTPIMVQIRELKRQAPHVLVATPGRLQDLIERKAIKLDQIEFMILDEADEMLNMGFQEDIDNILKFTPEEKVLWLFSATMPNEIRRIISTYMEKPIEVRVLSESKTNENIDHKYIYVSKSDKQLALKRVLDYLTDFYGVVFCKTKLDCQALAEFMEKEGYRSDPLHGDMSQAQRDAVMARFRNKTTSILVATDVAARGIDVDSLTHVVHYSLPENPEYYTHRSGRTARAGKKGTSLAIVTPDDLRRIRFFERSIGITINHIKVPLQSQMYVRKLDKWTDKILNTDTVEVTEEMVEKAEEAFGSLSKRELLERMLALEFNRLYKKVEKDDLNLSGDRSRSERDDRGGRDRDRDRGRDGDRRDRERSSDRGDRGGEDRGGFRGTKKQNPHMDTFFINIGKIDNVHPGVLVDILASHAGINKKQVGDIDIQKRHCLVEIDKKASANLEKSKLLKYRGRKITIKREGV